MHIQVHIFRMLRNNADARRCSYFELGLPVVRAKGHLISRKRREIFGLLRRGGVAEVILDILRLSWLLSAMEYSREYAFLCL